MGIEDTDDGAIESLVAKTPIDGRIAAMITPVVREMGFNLVRVRLTGSRRPTLQIMIDRPSGGVEVDDCAEVSRTLSALLDVEDPIDREYVLEVSSPGLDRPLTRRSDFESFAGFEAKLELAELVDGRKRFRGLLDGVDAERGEVRVRLEDGTVFAAPFDRLSDAKLVLTEELVRASLAGRVAAADGAEIDVDLDAAEPADDGEEQQDDRAADPAEDAPAREDKQQGG